MSEAYEGSPVDTERSEVNTYDSENASEGVAGLHVKDRNGECNVPQPVSSIDRDTTSLRQSNGSAIGKLPDDSTRTKRIPVKKHSTSRSRSRRRSLAHLTEKPSNSASALPLNDFDKSPDGDEDANPGPPAQKFPLPLKDYQRYGRQMIVPQVGLHGQLSLKSARVLIVGLGGLGCPAAQYLAGAGVGTIGLMDGDDVEMSNLHRQILHTPETVGLNKTESAHISLTRFDDNITYHCYPEHMTPKTAFETVEGKYDLILDCTDQPSTRYMLSDIAVIAGIPLISASALKTDGQLLVLNNPPNQPHSTEDEKGFCYRCVFPKPPPATSVQPCSEAGILGPVVGTMGTLMATEAMKILTKPEPSKLAEDAKRMLIYSAYSDTPFRSIRLKGKRTDCPSCSWPPKIDRHTLESGSTDYVAFCGSNVDLGDTYRNLSGISPYDLARKYTQHSHPIIIDVRNKTEFGIAHLPHAINIPLSLIQSDPRMLKKHVPDERRSELHFVCRYGNDSRIATMAAGEYFQKRLEEEGKVEVFDVKGGLKAWKEDVDEGFPEY